MKQVTAAEHLDMNAPSITCPKCGRTSYNHGDIEHGYCGACHEFTGTPNPGIKSRSMRLREAGFVPRENTLITEDGSKIPSWGYIEKDAPDAS